MEGETEVSCMVERTSLKREERVEYVSIWVEERSLIRREEEGGRSVSEVLIEEEEDEEEEEEEMKVSDALCCGVICEDEGRMTATLFNSA